MTELMFAVSRGETQHTAELIKAGAKVDTANRLHKETALYYATGMRHLECVKLLIAAGADVNCRDDVRSFTQSFV